MTGESITIPAVLAGYGGGSGGGDNIVNASLVNSFRISTVADRLAIYACAQPISDVGEFCQLCFSLARGIDFAIASQEVPTKAPELSSLLKQVSRRKYEPYLQAAVLVLMTSAKSACRSGWFSEKDSEDLCNLANEISDNFCSATDFKSEPSGSQSIISTIMMSDDASHSRRLYYDIWMTRLCFSEVVKLCMGRFFPTMKMGQILAFLEVKPGYGAFVNDFHISKNAELFPEEIRLLVAQIDNMETSSCLISPPEVNFLLNGSGVEKRTNVFMDTSPQVPTVVSHILRYGTNLLQAVGEFNGNYIIVVAYMSMMSTPDPATLLNFLQPAPALEDLDLDIIEGPSRISLNCPISFKRIKTPVKGHLCKHLQCFDYDNYVDINSRRPSWRCPNCNQYVCFTDIRMDQDIVKVLKEVGENVTDVIISSDGSWKAIMESDYHNDEKTPDKSPEFAEGETVLPYSNGISNVPVDILDLTVLDDEMDEVGMGDTVDQKVFQANDQGQPYTNNPSNVNHTSHGVDDFWSGVSLSTYGLGTSNSTSNLQIGGVSEHTPNFMPLPVLTDALIPTSVMQGGVSSPTTLQRYQFGNSAVTNECGTFPSIVSHTTSRTPVAVQAIPALASQQRPRNNRNFMIHNGLSATCEDSPTSLLNNMNAIPFSLGMQQQFSMSNTNMLQASCLPASTLSSTELEHSFASVHPAQQFAGLQGPGQVPGPYIGSSGFSTEPLNSSEWQILNQRTPYVPSQSQCLTRSSASSFSQSHIQGSSQSGGVGQSRSAVNSHRAQSMGAVQQSSQTARPVQISINAAPLSVNPDAFRASPRGDQSRNMSGTVPVDLLSYQDWRPTRRMRGSLSGQAYADALKQYIIHPTQQAQPTRPANLPNLSPQLQALIANRVGHASPMVNHSSTV